MGLSLLEIMLAISFLFLMILSIGALVPDSFMRIKATADDMIAVNLADLFIENIRVMDLDDIVVGIYDGSVPTPQVSPSTPQIFPPDPYPYVLKMTKVDGKTHTVKYDFNILVEPFTDRDGDIATDAKQLTVRVAWERKTGGIRPVQKVITFQTLVRQK